MNSVFLQCVVKLDRTPFLSQFLFHVNNTALPSLVPSRFVTLRKSVEVVQVDRVQGGGHAARARAHANPDPRVNPALTRYATKQPSTLSLSLFSSLSSDLSFHLDRLPGCEVDFTRVATQGFQMAIWPRLLSLSRHMMLSVDQSEFSVHAGLAMEFNKLGYM